MGKLLQTDTSGRAAPAVRVDVFAVARPRVIPRNCPPRRGEALGFGEREHAVFSSFHQFSPVFTSLWGAVEVNAVQTKYDIDRGALAGLKNENTSP